MRGIQINNYFNNHITLNGKKVNQEAQPVIQHPKTKHLNPNLYEPQSNQLDVKPPPVKSYQLPPKKRTNTLVELKKHIPVKRSISTERHRNVVSAKKKEQIHSNSSDKEEEPLVNMSQKKLKQSSSKGGLGKRSKSTIIKATHVEVPKTTVKKEPKKFSSNPTDESIKGKSKRKKSKVEVSREMKPNKPLTSRKQFIPVASKEVPKKEKEKLTLTLGKGNYKQEKKPIVSGRKKTSGAPAPKKKESKPKPMSARERKPKKNKFLEELKEKYENQTILDGNLSHRIKQTQDRSEEDFMSVMNSLEKVLNSVGSKQKLKYELKMISEKLKEFKLQSESDKSEILQGKDVETYMKKVQITIEKRQQGSADPEEQKVEIKMSSEEEDSQVEEPLKHKIEEVIINNNDLELPEQHEKYEQNPLLDKRSHGFFFGEQHLVANDEDTQDRLKQIEALKQFKNESNKMMKKVGLTHLNPEPNEDQEETEKKEGTQISDLKPNKIPEQLVISNDSNLSNGSGHVMEDKYPVGIAKSPKFDQTQLMGIISLKEQFISNRHDKMSELVKKMFQKQLVSPRSFESQLKFLDKRFQDENTVLQNYKKQAEQMSSLINDIKKDKEEIQGIDELIRNEKWQEARKLVEESHKDDVIQQKEQENNSIEELHLKRPEASHGKSLKYSKDQLCIGGWEKQEGWERVQIKHSDIENNEFVDIGQITTRGRRYAHANLDKVDIDEQCGGTEQSIELQGEQCIYYNSDNDTEQKPEEGGLLKLVEIPQEQKEEDHLSGLKSPDLSKCNDNVFHIESEEVKEKTPQASIIEKNGSNLSGLSSQSDRKGFTTNLYFIKEYCIALCEFLRDNQIFKTQFKNNIAKPLAFNLPQLFTSLRNEDLHDYIFCERKGKVAISQLIWNEFNAQYQTLKFNTNQNRNERYAFQKQQQLIFIRMIYDVLNESLDYERPGSQFGQAFPWSQSAKHLKNVKQANQPDKDNVEAYDLMFGVAIARIIQWGSCLCGFLPDTVELQNTEIDEPYVNHIRQTRMAFLLQKMMAAEDSVMTNFEMQETELYYKLSKLIAEELLQEATVEIQVTFKDK